MKSLSKMLLVSLLISGCGRDAIEYVEGTPCTEVKPMPETPDMGHCNSGLIKQRDNGSLYNYKDQYSCARSDSVNSNGCHTCVPTTELKYCLTGTSAEPTAFYDWCSGTPALCMNSSQEHAGVEALYKETIYWRFDVWPDSKVFIVKNNICQYITSEPAGVVHNLVRLSETDFAEME